MKDKVTAIDITYYRPIGIFLAKSTTLYAKMWVSTEYLEKVEQFMHRSLMLIGQGG